ncbi:MAG: Ig-like domain-containing protein [Opitutaceae bacterium]
MHAPRFLVAALYCGLVSALAAATATLTGDTAHAPYAGGTVTFTATIGDYTSAAALGFEVTLPAGWSYLETSPGPAVTPAAGSTGTLGWAYVTIPTSPATFTFKASAPGGVAACDLAATAYLRSGGVQTTIPVATLHLAAATAPTVTTGSVAPKTTNAFITGTVESDNGSAVTDRGVVYSTTAAPTLSTGTVAASGSGTGSIALTLHYLSASTTYHARAYATNALGTTYGGDVSFTTADLLYGPTIGSPATTTDLTPTLSGTAAAGAVVSLAVDGTVVGNATADAAGAWSYTFSTLAVGTHAIVASVSDAFGSISATHFTLTIVASNFTAPVPDGYGSAATGGAAGTSVVAATAGEFTTYATSSAAYIITVSGTLHVGTVAVATNKTIQGADASATIDGCLNLSNVSNIVIRGLNLANPDGHALQLTGATKVFVTRCTFLDAAGRQVLATGSDQLTISWCEFAATVAGQASVQLGAENETTTPKITLHHNWWSTGLASALPAAASGRIHQYSDLIASAGNASATALSGQAQLLSEANVYNGVTAPLAKSGSAAIRVNDNTYTSCLGTPDSGSDTVFTPSYSYTLLDRAALATLLPARAGNTAGAGYTEGSVATAGITASATTVVPGTSATLTAGLSGATASTYQWRLNNAPISGATGATYTISSMAATHAGTYTVAIRLADGATVVSTPTTIALGTAPTPPPTPTPDKGGGGGACGGLLVCGLGLLVALRGRRVVDR